MPKVERLSGRVRVMGACEVLAECPTGNPHGSILVGYKAFTNAREG